jgi:hypothetical protein
MAQLLAVLLPPIPPGNTIHVKALLEGTHNKLWLVFLTEKSFTKGKGMKQIITKRIL